MANAPAWMPAPQVDDSCPKGLEYLSQIDQLVVKQEVELLEAFTGFEGENKYSIFNNQGQLIYNAAENSSCLQRQCCKNGRSFEMRILDNTQAEVISIRRPLRCKNGACCCASCRQFMEVLSAGNTIGFIQSECSVLYPKFGIYSADATLALRINAPCGGRGCSCSPKYTVTSINGEEIGLIQKKWSGAEQEIFTNADNFNISFPMDLDVKVKATLLAGLFLIDFLYFEQGNQNNA